MTVSVKYSGSTEAPVKINVAYPGRIPCASANLIVTREELIEIIRRGTDYLHMTSPDNRDGAKNPYRDDRDPPHTAVEKFNGLVEQVHKLETRLQLHDVGHSNIKINERLAKTESAFNDQRTINTILQTNICEDRKQLERPSVLQDLQNLQNLIKDQSRLDTLERVVKENESGNCYVHNNILPRLDKLERWLAVNRGVPVFSELSKLEDEIRDQREDYHAHFRGIRNDLFKRIEKIELNELTTEARLRDHVHEIGDIEIPLNRSPSIHDKTGKSKDRKSKTVPGYFGEKHQYKPRNKNGQYVKEVPGVNAPKIETSNIPHDGRSP